MGCSASKVANEDTVRRCKERRRLMKEAVDSRNLLAAAHADYLRSLRLTAASLSRFAAGEPLLSVSHVSQPVLLPPINTSHHPDSSLPPPTPSPPAPLPPPSSRQHHLHHHQQHRTYHQYRASFAPSSPTMSTSRLPHILSASPSPHPSARKPSSFNAGNTAAAAANAAAVAAASTPSKHSSTSAWDWENHYPPSPPDSDFFDRRKAEMEEARRMEEVERSNPGQLHHLGEYEGVEEEEEEEEDEGDDGGEEAERGEPIPCPQWEYTTTSSSDGEPDYDHTRSRSGKFTYGGPPRSEFGDFSEHGRPAPSEIASSIAMQQQPPPGPRRWDPSVTGSSSGGWAADVSNNAATTTDRGMQVAVRHSTLAEIVAAIEEYFVKAATAGDAVSELLEAGRAQFDRSFHKLKKTVYHSNSLLSVLSSRWSSKPPLAVRYKLDTSTLEGSVGGGKSHGSTLEQLLAWEKKLYEEVKARETVKIEHEKKLSTLQSQECRGKDDVKLHKTKASIKKLQSLIIVTSQAVATTSSAIIKVRDSELAPQLVELCFALLTMWRSMHQFHDVQNSIVQQVRGLVNRSVAESTSDLHRLATRDLEAAVSAWHSSFGRLITYQRDYVRSLYSWLKLTLSQVGTENSQSDCVSPISRELTSFCDEWKQALDRLPDTVASEAIKSFMNVIHVIYTKQADELKIKKRAEACSKELEKKSSSLRSIEKKYYQSYSMVGIGLPGNGRDSTEGQIFDARDPLAEKKSEIAICRRRVEDELTRHRKAVEVTRTMTLNNIQTGLPGVFQAMAGFSGLFVEALEMVCRRAGSVR